MTPEEVEQHLELWILHWIHQSDGVAVLPLLDGNRVLPIVGRTAVQYPRILWQVEEACRIEQSLQLSRLGS